MKKLIALVLIGLLCLSFLMPVVMAEGESSSANLSFGYVEGEAGDVVNVPFYVQMQLKNDDITLESFQMFLEFDSTTLKLIGSKRSDNGAYISDVLNEQVQAMENTSLDGEYIVAMTMVTAGTLQDSGVLLELEFEMLKDAKAELIANDVNFSFYDAGTDEQIRQNVGTLKSLDEVTIPVETVFLAKNAHNDNPIADDPHNSGVDGIDQPYGNPTDNNDNANTTDGNNYTWILWLVCGLVVVAAVVAFVIVKQKKKEQ